jgi:hypothetical protein
MSKRYFMNTRNAGMRFFVASGENDNDPTQNQYIRFAVVREKYQGDTRKVGYLAVDADMKDQNGKLVADRVEAESGVTKITEADYNKAMGIVAEKKDK